jgi:signal transduction histidine kinase
MKRESKLILLVFCLVVGPAVLLSLFAGRVLTNWQIVIQKRLEADAVRVLNQAVIAWEEELSEHPLRSSRASAQDSYSLGLFIVTPGVGLTYPPSESTESSFTPSSVVSESAVRAAGWLQQAAVLHASGETNAALECLRKVAKEDLSRDPDEGFYYDLIALKQMAELESSAADTPVRALEEARRRVLVRYDDLVPLQRDLMVEWIEKEGFQGLRGGGVQGQESGFIIHHSSFIISSQWRERMRGRALTVTDRGKLAEEIGGLVPSLPESGWIKARIGGQEALVRRRVQGSGGEGEIVVLQFDEARLREHLNELFSRVATNSGIAVRIKDPDSSAFHPPSFILHAVRLPAPLEFITLEATPADPRAFVANARLQARLYGLGGGLLLISVVAGVWLIWRQAAGEIRDARERTDFAATVSHDLRTPLSSMRMLAESLYMGNIVDEAKKQTFLGAIVKESDRLSRLTDRALYFIRYGQGALRYQFTEGDLGSLVKDVAETFAVGIGGSVEEKILPRRHGDTERGKEKENVLRFFKLGSTPFVKIAKHLSGERGAESLSEVERDLSDSPPRRVAGISDSVPRILNSRNIEFSSLSSCLRASVVKSSSPVIRLALDLELPQVRFDSGAMEQVMFNLLDNAVKYSSPEKGVRIEVSLTARSRRLGRLFRGAKAAASEVVLSVKDNGVGMTPDEIRRVMKPYARGRWAAKQNARGIGLGLALCHHVIQAHRGRIEIKSEPGKGTTFSVILPAAT